VEDKSTINELLARYPTLSGEERKRDVIMKVMDGLNYARNEALYAIEEFTQKGTSNTGSSNFSAWLSKTREKYEAITLNR